MFQRIICNNRYSDPLCFFPVPQLPGNATLNLSAANIGTSVRLRNFSNCHLSNQKVPTECKTIPRYIAPLCSTYSFAQNAVVFIFVTQIVTAIPWILIRGFLTKKLLAGFKKACKLWRSWDFWLIPLGAVAMLAFHHLIPKLQDDFQKIFCQLPKVRKIQTFWDLVSDGDSRLIVKEWPISVIPNALFVMGA